jgi:hypothetical protein
MKKVIKNIILPVLLVALSTLTCGSIKENEKIGIFKNAESQPVAPVSREIGLFNSNDKEEDKNLEGSLRAGGDMGGGQAQKIPAGDALWVILLGSAGYSSCFLRRKK